MAYQYSALWDDTPRSNVKLLGGRYANVPTAEVVGYCHNREHTGVLTLSTMRARDCVAKECHHFERYDDSPYWRHVLAEQEKKQARKKMIKRLRAEKEHREAAVREAEARIFSYANRTADALEFFNFRLVSVRRIEDGYIIFYISDIPANDWYAFRELTFVMGWLFQTKFILRHARTADGAYALL